MIIEKTSRLVLPLLFLFSFNCTNILHAQKTYFENVDVEEFAAPYNEITITVYGASLSLAVTNQTKFKGDKNKKLAPEQVKEGTTITKLAYKLEGANYVATTVETEVSADGSITITGLFEGVQEGMAIIDGYPVRVAPGTAIKGEHRLLKKGACECTGFAVPSFDHPLLPAGQFYVEVKGFQDDSGVVTANDIFLCRNTYGKPEQQLLAAANNSLIDGTERVTQVPNGVYSPPMGLFSGQIQVGQYSYPLTNDIELQGYVNQVGHRVLPEHASSGQNGNGEISYRFYVIDDPVPNAFAFPNGMIFVHTGLLNMMDNEAQLAIVLGHEIAHVTHEHGRQRYATNDILNKGNILVNTFFENSLRDQFAKAAPNMSPEMLNTLTTVSTNITPEAISNIIKPQPKLEKQADRVGMFYAHQAGYDIREAVKFWNKMEQLTASNSFQQEVTDQLLMSLNSDRLRYGSANENPVEKLGAAGSEVLAKQFLDTIYTSHPKARTRARSMNDLVNTVYSDTDWSDTRTQEERYLQRVGR
ncbi:MAG: M48 family metallopeptidase [Bacteroidota bacterium]